MDNRGWVRPGEPGVVSTVHSGGWGQPLWGRGSILARGGGPGGTRQQNMANLVEVNRSWREALGANVEKKPKKKKTKEGSRGIYSKGNGKFRRFSE